MSDGVAEVGLARRVDGVWREVRDRVVVEAPLELVARGTPVATIMRTPGDDVALVRGLLHAEALPAVLPVQGGADRIELDLDPAEFAGRGLLASAACGVCGRVAIADLERRARTIEADTRIREDLLLALPATLRAAQREFDATGGLHAAGLVTLEGALVDLREDVGRHNALDKLIGHALARGDDPAHHAIVLSGRLGYELVQKAIRFGCPILAGVSAPSSLAIDLAERFGICLAGFVRPPRANVYAHFWRVIPADC